MEAGGLFLERPEPLNLHCVAYNTIHGLKTFFSGRFDDGKADLGVLSLFGEVFRGQMEEGRNIAVSFQNLCYIIVLRLVIKQHLLKRLVD